MRGRNLLTGLGFLCFSVWSMSANGVSPQKKKHASEISCDSVWYKVSQIVIVGNDVTKERVILKELPFAVGDSVSKSLLPEEIIECRQNLLKTSLFNYVYVEHHLSENNEVELSIRVEERWYWWVFPIIEPADRNLSSFFANGNWDMMNYGAYIQRDNFRGRQETLKFRLRVGYGNQLSVLYKSPEFNGKIGWGLSVNYNVFDNVPVFTVNDKPVSYKDFGHNLYSYYNGILFMQYRKSLNTRYSLELNYFGHNVADTIQLLNPNFLNHSSSSLEYFVLSLSTTHDSRDSKSFPLNGFYQSLKLSKYGLGMFSGEPDFWSVKGRANFHFPIGKKFYTAIETMGEVCTTQHLPYVMKNGLGYRDFISGYEYYVINGTMMGLNNNKLRYELVSTRVRNINFIPSKKFSKVHYALFLKGFFDSGYVWNKDVAPSNKMTNNYLYGYGVGVDFVTFYDKVFSFNYAINKFGENGLFFHLNIPLD